MKNVAQIFQKYNSIIKTYVITEKAALRCPKCQTSVECCIITGYPLLKSNTQNCKKCGKGGIKEFWIEYLQNFANCPWCNQLPN